jgi:hypothetical protein
MPSYRGEVWIHAAMKGGDDVPRCIEDVVKTIPLRGRPRPRVEDLAALAGHIVGKARIVGVERNTLAVCLADPWAAAGQIGLKLDQVEVLKTPIPWKGGQGLVDVDPRMVELVAVLARHGHRLSPGDHGVAGAGVDHVVAEMKGLLAEDDPKEDLRLLLEAAKLAGQLRQEGGFYLTRAVPKGAQSAPPAAKPKPPAPTPAAPPKTPTQGTFGW